MTLNSEGLYMRRLPVDLSTFSELRENNYVYVDKTEYIYQMITGGRRYFLSRPRRFGKSLLVSTLKEVLQGNRRLFNDLWISGSDYAWKEHGVIVLDFSRLTTDSIDLFKSDLDYMLRVIAEKYGLLAMGDSSLSVLLEKVVSALYGKYGRVAILVDEYDSPLLKTLHNQDLAVKLRAIIQQFFTTIKALDAQVQFVFITGVSSFAKAGLFSGINNLQIITLDKRYSGICGYTDSEVDHYFFDHISQWSHIESVSYNELRQKIKDWYNGYSFGYNVPKVYNPFSVMKALHAQEFENFWFQSGAPTFLIEILKKEYKKIDLEKLETSKDALGIFDVDAVPLVSLMFQAGYVTVIGYDPHSNLYQLDMPNWEVRKSLQKYLLEVFAHIDAIDAEHLAGELRGAFNNKNLPRAVELLQQLFAHVPYQLHSKEEKFYHALLMMAFTSGGMNAQAEYSTDKGRIDIVLDMPSVIYVMEIKFNESADVALAQIEERRYYERFMGKGKDVILLGMAFKREPHNFTITYEAKSHH
jgi:hypothetical protein